MEVDPNDDFTLNGALDMGLGKSVEFLSKVGEQAAKEFGIEQLLHKMWGEWEPVPVRSLSIPFVKYSN